MASPSSPTDAPSTETKVSAEATTRATLYESATGEIRKPFIPTTLSKGMAQFETEGDARQYVEQNPDEVVHVDANPLGELWFGLNDEGEFTVLRAAGPLTVAIAGAHPSEAEPHEFESLGDDKELPEGPAAAVPRDDTPLGA